MILFADSTLMIPKCIKFKISLTMKINLTMKLFRIIILLLSLQAIVNAQDMKGMDMTKKKTSPKHSRLHILASCIRKFTPQNPANVPNAEWI